MLLCGTLYGDIHAENQYCTVPILHRFPSLFPQSLPENLTRILRQYYDSLNAIMHISTLP